jgi:copper(I)-binding protein
MAAVAALAVETAWVRTSPMMELAGAAYMIIRNDGLTDDALVSVSSPASAVVELHETTGTDSGEMSMAPVDAIAVPAGGMVELEPGGYHVMLIDLVEPLGPGMSVDLSLTFASGAVLDVRAVVRDEPPASDASMAPTAYQHPG